MSKVQNRINLQIQKDVLLPSFFNEISEDYESKVSYCRPSLPDEIATIINLAAFPRNIAKYATNDQDAQTSESQSNENDSNNEKQDYIPKHIVYGCISEIERYYCIIENQLFLWKVENTEEYQQLIEEDPIITSVSIMSVSPNLPPFYPAARFVLAVSTSHYIKFFIINSSTIDFNFSYKVNIDFPSFCMIPGNNGTLIISSDRGNIYIYDFDTDNFVLKGSTKRFFRSIKQFLFGDVTTNYCDMTLDSSGTILSVIDENNSLHFYNISYENYSFTHLNCSIPDEYEFVSVSYLPFECISNIIGFCKDGRRILFGFETNSILNLEIKSIIPPPSEFTGHQLQYGYTTMGITTLFCNDIIIIMRAQRSDLLHHFYEFVIPIENIGNVLSYGFSFLDFELDDPYLWQHTQEPPIAYVLTTKGSYKFQFSTPCQSLYRFLMPNESYDLRYGINNLVTNFLLNETSISKHYFELFDNLNETAVNIILLCSYYPNNSKWILSIMSQYFNKKITKYEYENKITEGFYIRVSRLLSKVMYQPIFIKYNSKKNQEKWMINQNFINLSKVGIFHLHNIEDFIQQYLEIKQSSITFITKEQKVSYENEKEELNELYDYILKLNDVFTFFGFLSQQKKILITEIIKRLLTDKSYEYLFKDINLETQLFYKYDINNIIDIMQKISFKIFTSVKQTDPNIQRQVETLAQNIVEHCPTLFKVNNRLINSAMTFIIPDTEKENNETDENDNNDDNNKQKIFSVSLCTNIFIQYISQITKEDLHRICEYLITNKEYKAVIDIIIAKVTNIDKYHRALKWYKKGSNEIDIKGKNIFKEVYETYSILFDIIKNENGLKMILNTKDELMHLIIYQRIIDENDEKKLLDLQSVYIDDFIMKEARSLYWKRLIKQHKVMEAIEELMFIAENAEDVEKEKKLEWLEIAKKYAVSQNAHEKIRKIDELYAIINK